MEMCFGKRVGVGVLLLVVGAIVVPNFQRERTCGSVAMRCQLTQRSLQGAIEMYCVDNNLPLERVSRELADELVTAGYLQTFPACRSHEGTLGFHLVALPEGRLACSIHGVARTDPSLSPRQHVVDLGIEDPEILSHLSTLPADTWLASVRYWREVRWRLSLTLLFLFVAWILQPLLLKPRPVGSAPGA